MATLTLQNLDPALLRFIEAQAKLRGETPEQAAQRLLRDAAQAAPLSEGEPIGDRILRHAGGWTADDVRAFHKAIEPLEQIDEEMWQ